MSEPEPQVEENVERATKALGEPLAVYRASPARQRAKLFAALGLILFGIVANSLWFGVGPARADHYILHLLIWPPAIGFGLLFHMYRHRGLRVLVYPTGLLRLQHGEAESFPWEEIESVRAKLDVHGQPRIERNDGGNIDCVLLATTVPRFQLWNVWIEVTRQDGAIATFTAALADFPELVERIQRATFAPLLMKAMQTLDRGGAVEFGDRVTVTNEAITSKKASIPWKDVKKCGLLSRMLQVKRKNSWRGGIVLDTTVIPNLPVLFALSAEHGASIEDDA